jgi:hypothetical protein
MAEVVTCSSLTAHTVSTWFIVLCPNCHKHAIWACSANWEGSFNPFTANFASLHNGRCYSLCHILSIAKIWLSSNPFGRAQCGVSPAKHFHVHFVDFCFANVRIIFIGHQKSSIHLAQPVALAAIQFNIESISHIRNLQTHYGNHTIQWSLVPLYTKLKWSVTV